MLALLALALTQLPAERPAPRLALDVANGKLVGRRLIHVEDLVGPKARAVAGTPPARAVLVLATALDECAICDDHFARLLALHEKVALRGGVVVALVLATRETVKATRERLSAREEPYILALDSFGLARSRLGLLGPGSLSVLRSDGSMLAGFVGESGFDAAIAVFERELEEERP